MRGVSVVAVASVVAVGAVVPAHAQPSWDDDGFAALDVEETRLLPTCGPGATAPPAGQAFTCRPPLRRFGWPWSLALRVGGTLAMAPGAAAAADDGVGPGLDLGVRVAGNLELLALARADRVEHVADGYWDKRVFAGLRYRLFTDEIDRDAWALSVAAGHVWAPGRHEPATRIALGREVGLYMPGRSWRFGLEVGFEAGLGDARTRTVDLSYRVGFESGVRVPQHPNAPDAAPQLDYTLAAEASMGVRLSLGVAAAVGLGRRAEVLGRALRVGSVSSDDVESALPVERSAGALLALGPRFAVLGARRREGIGSLLAGVSGGAFWRARDGALQPAFGGEVAGRLNACKSGLEIGGAVDFAAADGGVNLLGVQMFLRWVGGTGIGHGRCIGCTPTRAAAAAPSVEPARGAAATVEVDATVRVPSLEVTVPIGVAVAGVSVAVDLGRVPWAQLAAGTVEVTISGPAAARAAAQADLRAQLSARGVEVTGWGEVEAGGAVINATFKVFPRVGVAAPPAAAAPGDHRTRPAGIRVRPRAR